MRRMHRPRADQLEIGVLYGFRAMMVLFVMNYHLWQQSWISQSFTVFGRTIGFDFWTRSSYLFVDGMILLSGFLLYLPHARALTEGTPAPSVRRFYFNRAVRILPSYLFAVLVALFCIAIPQRLYPSTGAMLWDVISHLTFTFLFWPATYVSTPLNVALWTIAVEVQFYLLFPLLAKAMKKHPALTAGAMMLCAWVYRLCVARFATDTTILINQLPSFLDVYAIGMLGAAGYCRMRLFLANARRYERMTVEALSIAIFAACAYGLISILKAQSSASLNGHEALRLSQMAVRLPLAVTLGLMMFSAAHWPRMLQRLLDNPLMRFLSTISMNLYIWHQVLAVQMRLAWFPDVQQLHT
ncbi:MAG: acyltransferase, partial [Clostridia bacterium]|nr:acyltransferase [Clostridia bacterium]